MKEAHDMIHKVKMAQASAQSADELIAQYLPFIKAEAARLRPDSGQAEDELSIAMFAFYEAIRSYQPARGAFLKLASAAIRNRIIDYRRKQLRHSGQLSLDSTTASDDERTLGQQIPDPGADLAAHQDRADTKAEIAHFSQQLQAFDLTLADVAENCPKQARTLKVCMQVLHYARQHPQLLDQLVRTKKLPLSQLVLGAKVDKKTLERHRKYIVAILLAYTNGFEIIRGHISSLKGKEDGGL